MKMKSIVLCNFERFQEGRPLFINSWKTVFQRWFSSFAVSVFRTINIAIHYDEKKHIL